MSIVEDESISGPLNDSEPCSSTFKDLSNQKSDEDICDQDQGPILEDDDFDEFGDFEEATDSCQPEASTSVASLPVSHSTDFELVPELVDVSDNLDLWTTFGESHSSCAECSPDLPVYDQITTEVCDLFARFDLNDEEIASECQAKDFELHSLRLWKLLCYVEETAALKFLWNRSTAYSEFLNALHIRNNAMCGQINTASLTSKLPSFSALDDPSSLNIRGNTNTIVNANNPNSVTSDLSTVDSLSVAPAEFDWRNSGLENPFTSSSTTAISACVLECDNFFSADGNSTHSNGPSILEKELERMGLSNGHAALPSISNSLSVDLNELIRKNASTTTKLATPNGSQAKKYKNANELSLEAKALHDRLPDYTYMLADRLMFPLSGQSEQLPGNSM